MPTTRSVTRSELLATSGLSSLAVKPASSTASARDSYRSAAVCQHVCHLAACPTAGCSPLVPRRLTGSYRTVHGVVVNQVSSEWE